jgi:hypothetical protein
VRASCGGQEKKFFNSLLHKELGKKNFLLPKTGDNALSADMVGRGQGHVM